jgi:hypothetical protein
MEAELVDMFSVTTRDMAMNPGTKKLYFVETKKNSKSKEHKEKPFASVNVKLGTMVVGTIACQAIGLDGKFYKPYHDATHKVIGFKVNDRVLNEEQRKGWRFAKLNKGQLFISVKPAINSMAGLKDKYKKLEIKRYKDYQSQMDSDVYYYVELK